MPSDFQGPIIVSISPDPDTGRGGISSAVAAVKPSLLQRRPESLFIVSHTASARLSSFLHALVEVRALKNRPRILWLHCGPWLSTLRKLLLALSGHDREQAVLLHLHSAQLARYLRQSLPRYILRVLIERTGGTIVLSGYWRKLVAETTGVCETKLHVVPNAVEASFAARAEELAMESAVPLALGSRIRVTTMARLIPEKGVDRVFKALAELPSEYELTVAGDGPERAALERLASELGIDQRVRFVGWLDREMKLSLLTHSDLFCLPSRHDSFGIAFAEAMACGVPVVAVRNTAVEEVVIHGLTGIVAESDDPRTLARAIITAVGQHAQLRQQGLLQVRRLYTPDSVAARVDEVVTAVWADRL